MGATDWANLLTVFHFLIVAVAVLAVPVIVVGLLLGQGWARNFWLRLGHLLFIGFVVGETAIGVECPLTTWERELRWADGADLHELGKEPCLARFAHNVTFLQFIGSMTIEEMLPYYVGFGLLVLLTRVLGPPRWPWLGDERKKNATKNKGAF